MTRRHYAYWLAAALCGGIGLLAVLHPGGEKMLLDSASVLIPTKRYVGGPYYWLTDSSILIGRDLRDSQSDRTGLFRWVIPSRTLSEEAALHASLHGANSSEFQIYSDGQWLLTGVIQDHTRPGPIVRCYYVCRTGGTCVMRRTVGDRFKGARWLADGRHWIEMYGRHRLPMAWRGKVWASIAAAPVHLEYLTVQSADSPDAHRLVSVGPASLLRGRDMLRRLFPITESRFLMWNSPGTAPSVRVVVTEIRPNAALPSRTFTATMPAGATPVQAVYSPRGDRILWKLKELRRPAPAVRTVERILPGRRPMIVERTSLWVCRIDGTGMHEIGGVNNDVPELQVGNGPVDPESGEYLWGPPTPRMLRWAPDGRRISFAYPGGVWVAPAD